LTIFLIFTQRFAHTSHATLSQQHTMFDIDPNFFEEVRV